MNEPLALDQPAHYRIWIRGHLSPGWAEWFGNLELEVGQDGAGYAITTLRGLVEDQAQLHAILTRIRDMGLTLLRVELEGDYQMEESDEANDD